MMKKAYLASEIPNEKNVAAIIPETAEDGAECTCILKQNGESSHYPGWTCHTIAGIYAEREDKSLPRVGQHCAAVLGASHGSVYPISPDLTFLALKCRQPIYSSHHRTCAYVNITQPLRIIPAANHPEYAAILFPSGAILPTLWSPKTVRQKLNQARLVYLERINKLRAALLRAEQNVCKIDELDQ